MSHPKTLYPARSKFSERHNPSLPIPITDMFLFFTYL